ncbi:MAG TPA: hypothetical protein VHO69_08140 [Phototrophicaceae bacterium]|nr:hypothetical protein [Phototrophicaceae bacterium]
MKNYKYPLQLAKEALLLHRYPDAIQLLKPLSQAGHPDAAFLHGYLHFWDDDLSRTEAIQLITSAAAAGHAEANYILAVCPDLTPGYTFQLPTNPQRLTLLQRAADAGSNAALTDLAQCYLEGIGVKPAPKQARKLLMRAYEGGDRYRRYPKCCLLLAKLLLDGIGGEPDFDAGLLALTRCQWGYGDPFAAEAITFFIEAARNGKYEIHENQRESLVQEFEPILKNIRSQSFPLWQRYLNNYCLSTLVYDLRDADFEDFVGFVFEHWVTSRKRNDFHWEDCAVVFFNPSQLLQYYTQLFREPEFLLERYNRDEINCGLEVIREFNNWTVGCVLDSSETTVAEAEACIRATYDLFAKLLSKTPYDSVGYMWWDAGYGRCGGKWRGGTLIKERTMTDEDHKRLYQVYFETMVSVLQLPSRPCQTAAIHGLGHSKHPDKERVLRQYLADHPDLSDRSRSYVMEAIKGEIL